MKLTWFGGTVMRVHIGGEILVCDPDVAPGGIDRVELVAGADRVFSLTGSGLAEVDLAMWRPRRQATMLEGGLVPVEVLRGGDGVVLVDAPGEAPLLLAGGVVPTLGRWAESAVVVLVGAGEDMLAAGRRVLEERTPRLLVLAGVPEVVEVAFSGLRDKLDGAGMMVLEAGLALEV